MQEFESGEKGVDDEILEVSRTSIKHQMWALQELGALLMEMKASSWEAFSLREGVMDALHESKRITAPNARRRHTRRLGKLLLQHGEEFTDALREKIADKDVGNLRRAQRLERWRDRLVEDNQAFTDFANDCVDFDRQHLRQLIRNAQKQKDIEKLSVAKRKLFSYLKTLAFSV